MKLGCWSWWKNDVGKAIFNNLRLHVAYLDEIDVVSSGEVEAIKNDELMQVDHPDSGLRDVLLQNCLCQTSFHLCRKTDARLSFGQL